MTTTTAGTHIGASSLPTARWTPSASRQPLRSGKFAAAASPTAARPPPLLAAPNIIRPAPRRSLGALGSLGAHYELDGVPDRVHRIHVLVGDLDPELVLEREDDVHEAGRVHLEVVEDVRTEP